MPGGFGPATREWFAAAFAAPTAAQTGAWHSVAAGRNALVVAPTGSGKTLAAFLWSLDRIARTPPPPDARRRCRVLYVSPLKALAVDVERNLRAPLAGIRQAATRLGIAPPEITVGMRTGDTPADERRAFARTPPDILITTPESLFLLLTSAARESLRGVETVIVDEVHAVAGTKRGAHLALSLERLDALLPAPAQRIGLSATVRPVDTCARFLGGARAVDVVQPATDKTIEVDVQVPVEDMTRLDDPASPPAHTPLDDPASPPAHTPLDEPPSPPAHTHRDDPAGPYPGEPAGSSPGWPAGPVDGDLGGPGPRRASIWPAVEERVLALIRAHRSTIVFTNSRRSAERLCARLNELAAEEAGTDPASGRPAAAGPAAGG
ncbi:DEAD/DEAH box helicase, partial [Micromonospora rosaria]|uniref:DEAD/DEAH box helicase n=1 Tax=Micromonospora rosaria TaxID=47874 RepID=UPI000A9F0B2B